MEQLAQLLRENEKLHTLLADASTVLLYLAEVHRSEAAADCLERIAAGEPATAGPMF
jgi:hypothetical protein